jgi:PAS domain S-box-containing protein
MENKPAPEDRWAGLILRSAIAAGEALARSESGEKTHPEILATLGKATGVSRACAWRNVTLSDGRLAMDMHAEWTAPGVEPVIGNETNHNWPYDDGYIRLQEALSKGEVIAGPVSEFPPNERADLEAEGIVSVAFAPLFVGGRWWGFLGYDDCEVERSWSEGALEALRVVASTLSNAFLRDELATELRKSERMMRTHIEGIPAITYVESIDAEDSEYVGAYISPQVETLLGYTPEEWFKSFETYEWLEAIHADDRERVRELADASNESGEPFIAEYRRQRKDREWVWLAEESRRVDPGDGSPPYWHGLMTDITARKQAEERLRDAEEQFRSLVDNVPGVVYLDSVDENDSEIYVSPKIEELLGVTPEKWLASDDEWSDLVHPDDKDKSYDGYAEYLEKGSPSLTEYRIVRKDGRVVWVREEAVILKDAQGNPYMMQGLIQDITEQKTAEEVRDFQAQLLQSISDAIIAYDTEEMVTSWNRAAEALYGWSPVEMVGAPLPEEIRYDPDRLVAIWDPFVEEKGGWRGSTVHRDKDGYEIAIETKGLPLLDANGNVRGFVMVNREAAES